MNKPFSPTTDYELEKCLASSTNKYEKDSYCVQWTLAHTYIKSLKGKVGHTLIIETHRLVQENILLPFQLREAEKTAF